MPHATKQFSFHMGAPSNEYLKKGASSWNLMSDLVGQREGTYEKEMGFGKINGPSGKQSGDEIVW